MLSYRWRDPFVTRVAALVQQAVREHDRKDSSSTFELECRLGTLASRRTQGRLTLPFPARCPTIFGDEIRQVGSFETGVAFQRLDKINDRLQKSFHRRLPSVSTRSLVCTLANADVKHRFEYTVTSPPRAQFIHLQFDQATDKRAIDTFDLHFPDAAADVRFGLSKEVRCAAPRRNVAGAVAHVPRLEGKADVAEASNADCESCSWSSIVAKSVRLRQRKAITLHVPRLGGLPIFSVEVTVSGNVGFPQQWSHFGWDEQVSIDLSKFAVSKHLHVEVEVCLPAVRTLGRREGSLDAAAENVAVELLSLVRMLSDP